MGSEMKRWESLYIVYSVLLIAVAGVQNASAGDAAEDAANTGFQLLEEPVNPRVIGMGSAGTALRSGGFAYYNPASPYLINRTYLSASYGGYPRADWDRVSLEGVISLEKWFIGVDLHTEAVTDLYRVDWTGKWPDMGHSSSWQFTNLSLDVGYSHWEDFAFALCFNYMQEHLFDYYAYALSGSAGVLYIPIPDRLFVGLSLTNIRFASTPMVGKDNGSAWGDGERLPLNSRFGLVWSDKIRKIPYTVALDIVYRNVRDRDLPFSRYIQDRFTVPVGIEVCPIGPLALRLGKRFNHPTEIINFGVGFTVDFLSTDVSFVIPKLVDDAEMKWLANITYYLIKKRHPKPPDFAPQKTAPPQTTVADTATQEKGVSGKPAQDTAAKPVPPDTMKQSRGEDTVSLRTGPVDTALTKKKVPDSLSLRMRIGEGDTASHAVPAGYIVKQEQLPAVSAPGLIPVNEEGQTAAPVVDKKGTPSSDTVKTGTRTGSLEK
jgi:hypothetical protein